jgi:hypothetical protein
MDERIDEEPTDTDALLIKLKSWCREDIDKSSDWRKEAREDFDMTAGCQWSEDDKSKLREANRPVITMNRIDPIVDSVSGSEVSNRQEVQYIPREQGDVQKNEVLTSAAQWFRDECDAEDEESDAFRDTIICGMGWTETRLDYDDNPDGEPKIERVDPLEMVWDTTAKKRNLKDMRRLFHIKRDIPIEEARAMCPGDPEKPFEDADYNATWVDSEDGQPANVNDREEYDNDEKSKQTSDKRVTLVRAQWWEREAFWRVQDPANPENILELGDEEHAELKAKVAKLAELNPQMPPLKAVQSQRRVYKQAYIGSVLLEIGDAPCKGHFSFNCITGKRDRNNNTWYGLVRGMKDPQRWSNKWLSQLLHILNTSAKGGIMAERGAFEDDKQAEKSWAKNDTITWAKSGALAGEKIQPKPQVPAPQGFFQLTDFAIDAIRQTSGVNVETLGMREATQAASLEYQRRQSAMTILQPLFDSLRRYRKMQGRQMLYLIQNYLSDGRLIKIVGEEGAKYVPLVRQTSEEYDIIVDDAPSSPNQKEAVWAMLTQLLPVFGKVLPPQTTLALLKYSPLPTAAQDDIKKSLDQQQQQPDPEMEKMKAEFALKQQSAEADIENTRKKADAEIEIMTRKANVDAALKIRQQQADAFSNASNNVSKGPDGELIQQGPDNSAIMGQLFMTILDKLEQMNAPKMILKDANGEPIGLAPMPPQGAMN